MGESVFKGVEIVGTSNDSFSHAIEVAVRRARQTLRELSWFVVAEQRGGLQQGRLEYQVTLRVYFKLDDADQLEGDDEKPRASEGESEKNAARAMTASKSSGSRKGLLRQATNKKKRRP